MSRRRGGEGEGVSARWSTLDRGHSGWTYVDVQQHPGRVDWPGEWLCGGRKRRWCAWLRVSSRRTRPKSRRRDSPSPASCTLSCFKVTATAGRLDLTRTRGRRTSLPCSDTVFKLPQETPDNPFSLLHKLDCSTRPDQARSFGRAQPPEARLA